MGDGHYLRRFFWDLLLDGLALIVGCEFVASAAQKYVFAVLGPYYYSLGGREGQRYGIVHLDLCQLGEGRDVLSASPEGIVDAGFVFFEESHEIGMLIDAFLPDKRRSFFFSRGMVFLVGSVCSYQRVYLVCIDSITNMKCRYFSLLLHRLISDDGGLKASLFADLLSHASDLYLILFDFLGRIAVLVQLWIISICTLVIIFTIFAELDVLMSITLREVINSLSYSITKEFYRNITLDILITPPSEFLQVTITIADIIIHLIVVLCKELSILGQGKIMLLDGHLMHSFIEIPHHLIDTHPVLQHSNRTVFHS